MMVATLSASLHGAGPAADAAARALEAIGAAAEGLTLWVAPSPIEASLSPMQAARQAMETLYFAPLELAQSLRSELPEPGRDQSGEPIAQRQLLFVVERALLVPGGGRAAEHAATAAFLAWVADAALNLAPRLRINVIALPLQAPPDLGPSLSWLAGRAIVTGQVLKLGPPPPSTAPFRGDTR